MRIDPDLHLQDEEPLDSLLEASMLDAEDPTKALMLEAILGQAFDSLPPKHANVMRCLYGNKSGCLPAHREVRLHMRGILIWILKWELQICSVADKCRPSTKTFRP